MRIKKVDLAVIPTVKPVALLFIESEDLAQIKRLLEENEPLRLELVDYVKAKARKKGMDLPSDVAEAIAIVAATTTFRILKFEASNR